MASIEEKGERDVRPRDMQGRPSDEEADTAGMLPQAREWQEHQKLEKARKDLPLEPSEGV